MEKETKFAILGAGNLGQAIANGLHNSQIALPKNIYLTRKNVQHLASFQERGFQVTRDNQQAVKESKVIILSVQPQQLNELLLQIKNVLNAGKHIVISVVSGASIKAMKSQIGDSIPVVRAMPNTAIAIQESMTCLSTDNNTSDALSIAETIFNSVGITIKIPEELMIPATSLGACGIAFFMRAIRAASQGGIEIGFHSQEALLIAAQTAKGAASLILKKDSHPETEVDKVTTPRGCTISGLNEMEHHGFSSALIRGIVTSADKAAVLYSGNKK
ncbi:MAG: pyrroline-5-carboxylate reductase [Calditrichota bacterium]